MSIHIERAIGRIKKCDILQGVFPLSMVHLANQIECLCLVDKFSASTDCSYSTLIGDTGIEKYFQALNVDDTESETERN